MSHDTPDPEPEREPVPEPVVEPVPTAASSPAEPGAEAESVPADAPALVPDAAAAPVPADAPPPPSYKPRRRGRTTLLIASAAVLGVLAGGGLGYRVQQNREPTPLPPLIGPMLAQPKGVGPDPARPAGQDRDVVYQADLFKLLMPTPKGAEEQFRDWMSLSDYADSYNGTDYMFRTFATNDYQRGVRAEWTDPHKAYVIVSLTQFRDEAAPYAPELFIEQQELADDDPEDGPSHAVPGVSSGYVWGSAKAHKEAGYLPEYEARGLAQIGNIYVEVFVNSPHPVPYSTVMSVMKKQLERL